MRILEKTQESSQKPLFSKQSPEKSVSFDLKDKDVTSLPGNNKPKREKEEYMKSTAELAQDVKVQSKQLENERIKSDSAADIPVMQSSVEIPDATVDLDDLSPKMSGDEFDWSVISDKNLSFTTSPSLQTGSNGRPIHVYALLPLF